MSQAGSSGWPASLRAALWLAVTALLFAAMAANVYIGFEQPFTDAGFIGIIAISIVMSGGLFFLALRDL